MSVSLLRWSATIAVILTLASISCTSVSTSRGKQVNAPTYDSSSTRTIRIGSWNLQKFGRTKASRPKTMSVIVAEIRKYDLIAIQEIKDSSGEAWTELLKQVNSDTDAYSGVISPPGNERYGFIFRKDRVRLKSSWRQENVKESKFAYPPYSAYFEVVSGTFDFLVINVHVRPSLAREEIAALPDISRSVLRNNQLKDEDDVIILGDFNADCKYFDESSKEDTERAGFTWIIADNEITNVAGGCTYDRMIVSDGVRTDFSGVSGTSKMNPTMFFQDGHQVSDHIPIFADFFVDRDSD